MSLELEGQVAACIEAEVRLIDACGQLCVDGDSIRRGVRKALSLLSRREPSGGWRGIESAPRDRFVLLAIPASEELDAFVAMAKWQGECWYGVDDEGVTFNPNPAWTDVLPTHWQPLPSPPLPADQADEGGEDA